MSVFLPVLRLFFTLLRNLELCDFYLYLHGSDSILQNIGAVIVLAGRQSDETVHVCIGVCRFVNVDMLIVTFKFHFGLTDFENIPL